MKLHTVPAAAGLAWVRQGWRIFGKQPLAFSGLFAAFLFVIFVLGPCEPLIPVLMYPASQHSLWGTVTVVLAFSAATIATMLTVVYLAISGLERLPLDTAERYSHALAGAALSLCGLGIVFLGL